MFADLGSRRHETLVFVGFYVAQAVDDFAGQPDVLWSGADDAPALQRLG